MKVDIATLINQLDEISDSIEDEDRLDTDEITAEDAQTLACACAYFMYQYTSRKK